MARAGDTEDTWAEGGYGQFAPELRNAPRLADKTDLAARILSELLDEAVGMIPLPNELTSPRCSTCPRKRTGSPAKR